jgi:hypothetical protein
MGAPDLNERGDVNALLSDPRWKRSSIVQEFLARCAVSGGNDHSLLEKCHCKRWQSEFFQEMFKHSMEGLRLRDTDSFITAWNRASLHSVA